MIFNEEHIPTQGEKGFPPKKTGAKKGLVPPVRFERTTPGLGIRCSILLSYGGAWNG